MEDRAYEISSVDRLIAVLNQGDDNEAATRDYRRIMETLTAYVGDYGGKHKAELTIKVGFTADHKGIDVAMDATAKLPKRPVTKERFFDSGKGTLTAKDPARDTMFPGENLGRRGAIFSEGAKA